MRITLSFTMLALLLAACTSPPEVSSSPPAVSYQVTGNDLGQAGANAQRYCQQYGTSARFQGIQATTTGNVAVYTCGS
jgi:hypothetical protein